MASQAQTEANRRNALNTLRRYPSLGGASFYRALNELERLRAMGKEQSQSPVGETTRL